VPLSRDVSRKRAFEMLFTGEGIDAFIAKRSPLWKNR
jgi:enoyl-CoA hydratase/carnithine racemase